MGFFYGNSVIILTVYTFSFKFNNKYIQFLYHLHKSIIFIFKKIIFVFSWKIILFITCKPDFSRRPILFICFFLFKKLIFRTSTPCGYRTFYFAIEFFIRVSYWALVMLQWKKSS